MIGNRDDCTNFDLDLSICEIGRAADPRQEGRIIASPCLKRPDSGVPCPLAGMSKENDMCETKCMARINGRPVPGFLAIIKALENDEIVFLDDQLAGYCPFPGCDARKNGTSYCKRHLPVISYRKRKFARSHGPDAVMPLSVLHAPIKPKRRQKS